MGNKGPPLRPYYFISTSNTATVTLQRTFVVDMGFQVCIRNEISKYIHRDNNSLKILPASHGMSLSWACIRPSATPNPSHPTQPSKLKFLRAPLLSLHFKKSFVIDTRYLELPVIAAVQLDALGHVRRLDVVKGVETAETLYVL